MDINLHGGGHYINLNDDGDEITASVDGVKFTLTKEAVKVLADMRPNILVGLSAGLQEMVKQWTDSQTEKK